MSLSVFGEKAVIPNEEMLIAALGKNKELWDRITNHITAVCDAVSEEWKYYGKPSGWTFVLKSGKRTLVYLIPMDGYLKANFVFGDKAVMAAQGAGLPDAVVSLIAEAKPYVEGRSFKVDVNEEEDISVVMKLLDVKRFS